MGPRSFRPRKSSRRISIQVPPLDSRSSGFGFDTAKVSILAGLIRLPCVNELTEQRLADTLRRLRPSLTRRARAIVSNHSDAEDVVQESAARAWNARSQLRPGADPAPWLSKIVTRVAIDFVRTSRRNGTVGYADVSAHHMPAEDRIAQSETLQAVNGAAKRLATGQRRVLFMHDYVGFTSHEIARLDGIPYHTVRTLLRRARQSVRDRLEEVS